MTANELLKQNLRFSLLEDSLEVEGDSLLIEALLPDIKRLKGELMALLAANGEIQTCDDRHYCRECLNYSASKKCLKQQFKPVDNILRRCNDFKCIG